MAQSLNKKILCFIDESGTAGKGVFCLGAVILFARDAGRFDKSFSDLLEPNVNEIHASTLTNPYLYGLLDRFRKNTPHDRVVFVNRLGSIHGGSPPVLYAQSLIETVKVGLKRFRKEVLRRGTISNVEVIIDVTHHNSHVDFDAAVSRARGEGGLFKSVKHVAKIDSAASRLLQLADIIAHSHKWILNNEMNATALRERFGIQII